MNVVKTILDVWKAVRPLLDPTKLQELNDALLELESTTNFHPRAWKLMEKKKNFVVVAEDEPYYLEVYTIIRTHESARGRWTSFDEQLYQKDLRK